MQVAHVLCLLFLLCLLCLLCVQPELMPVMAVGTSGGSIFLINPDTMTLYAKLRWATG
jgi:hypothetical protein